MLAIICSALIWTVLVGFFWSIVQAVEAGVIHLRRLHQIPCHRCAFFTGDHRLKCTVHPCRALTEEAIHCLDYEPNGLRSSTCLRCSLSPQKPF